VTTTRKEFAKADSNGRKRVSITAEMGVPTGQRWATYHEDFLPQLRGHNAVKYYREMSDNDATIGAILFGIEMLIRQVDWPVEPGGETPADEEAAAYLESCKDDMSHSWPDFISTVLSFLPYGWSFHEIVYKLRDGDNSQFDDGRVGWRKLAHQPQETLWEWDLDSHGGVQGFKWTAGGLKGEIPIEKGLLFRTTTARGPNGRSVLRNAFRSYQFKKRLEEILVIGVDRDLNGLPVFGMPADDVIDQGDMFEEAKKLVTRIHRDEQWGVVLPLEYDESGNALYSFDVMRSDAHLSLNSTAVYISQLSNAIADVVLAGFINLGKDAVGSRAGRWRNRNSNSSKKLYRVGWMVLLKFSTVTPSQDCSNSTTSTSTPSLVLFPKRLRTPPWKSWASSSPPPPKPEWTGVSSPPTIPYQTRCASWQGSTLHP
jgi:hypothetical protein